MNLPVTLAGFAAAWRFRGSAGLDAWLASRPWSGPGGARVVRIASATHGVEVARAIRQAVRGHDDGDTDVQVRIATAEQAAAGLRPAVEALLDLPHEPDRRRFLEGAARALAVWPQVLVFPPGGPSGLLAEVNALIADVRKVSAAAHATVLLLDTPARPLGADAFDLTVGGLADPVLGDPERRDAVLWRAYAHARLAWESAGDLARARRWDEQGMAGVAFGGDNVVENLFNQFADAAWAELAEAERQRLVGHLTQLAGQRGATPRAADVQALSRSGLLWRPPGEAEPRPVPYLARALLRSALVPQASFYLRGCLTCAPLAREVLSRCFDLEARQRAVVRLYADGYRVSPEAEERLRKFQDRQPGSGAEFYPKDCPALPTDPWAFMLFGEYLNWIPRLPQPMLRTLHDLRNVRNALAHCHYVSWNMVTAVRRLEMQLGG